MQVLIVKTSSMGDVLHTLPALTDAMQAIPGIQFDWVIEENFHQIPTWHPAVDRVIPVAIRRWRKNWFCRVTRQQRRNFKCLLQQRSYDAVIDAQGLMKSAVLVTSLAKGCKHGQVYKSAREPCASFFYNYRHKISKRQHAVERTRQLFAKSLAYERLGSYGDYAIVGRFLGHLPTDSGQYMVFLHATSRKDKCWPEKNWRELIKLVADSGLRIKLPWGAEHERARALRLAEGFAYVDVLPRLNLTQVGTVLVGATSVVSVDTGLSHLAAALNKPNITLFGPTDPRLIGAYGQNQYSCLPLLGNKMKNISSQQVYTLLQQQ
ncbi:Lipopolysaccharide heptosyltransferase 1 [Serratia symbiotica]|nr:Lipopolysaccharide heptosyltransferase 1 [Serratia symbiotica]